jgi:hypothetical protein
VNGSKSFASDYRRIQSLHRVARMAKLADARDLKTLLKIRQFI